MNILNIEHVSKIYGEKVIFDERKAEVCMASAF